MKFIDMTGEKYGKLLVIEYAGKTPRGISLWKCKCDCGTEVIVQSSNLRNGHTKSCGCFRVEWCKENCTKHGLEHTRLYSIWSDMIYRCHNQENPNYERYGGRGISVCCEWRNDVRAFYDWAINNGYSDDLTIDRVDNDGNYCPENCRWATKVEQASNRRSNVLITRNGETKTMKEWACCAGIPYKVVWARINKLGWGTEKALTETVRKLKRNKVNK